MTEQLTSPITNKVTVTSGSVAYAKSTIFPVKSEAKTYARTSIGRREEGETSADKATPADELISELNGLYEFKDDLVENFVVENPSLSGLLFEAYKIIPGFFASEVKMALEVVADPEALGDRQLFVLIRTVLPRKEARQGLAELDQEWWLNALPRAEGKMEIALE